MDSRIARRRAQVRQQRMRRRRRRTVIAFVLVAVVAGLLALERSPLMELAEVEVAGANRVSADAVRAAADLPLGTSTLRLDLDAARQGVAELPWVRSVEIRRRDPLTVLITVRERRPIMTLRAPGGSALVDADGVVLERGGDDQLPTLRLASGRLPEPGERLDADHAAANGFAVYRGLPGPLRTQVDRVDAQAADRAQLVLRDGTTVRFGRADRVDEKARALGALLAELDEPVTAIDVRAPSNPVVVP